MKSLLLWGMFFCVSTSFAKSLSCADFAGVYDAEVGASTLEIVCESDAKGSQFMGFCAEGTSCPQARVPVNQRGQDIPLVKHYTQSGLHCANAVFFSAQISAVYLKTICRDDHNEERVASTTAYELKDSSASLSATYYFRKVFASGARDEGRLEPQRLVRRR